MSYDSSPFHRGDFFAPGVALGPRLGRVLAPGPLSQNHVHLIAFLARHRLGDRHVRQLAEQPLQNPPPDLRVRHLAAAEEDRRLDLVALRQEALDVLLLELVVVLVHLRPELDLLDLDDLLVLLRFTGPLLFLVLVLAEVHDSAHRWNGGRGNLDQVEPLLPSNRQRLRRRHDSQLLSGFVDDPDLAHADALVGADPVIPSGRTIEGYNDPPGQCRRVAATVTLRRRLGSRSRGDSRRERLARYFFRRQSHELGQRPRPKVASRSPPNRHCALGHLPVSDDQHVGDLLHLCFPNFIANLLHARVQIRPAARLAPAPPGHGWRIPGADPTAAAPPPGRGPATAATPPAKCSISSARNRSKLPKMARWMTTGPVLGVVGPDVVEVEPLGQLVVQLDGGALPLPADGVGDVEVDLGPVKRAVALVDGIGLANRVERPLEPGLGLVPGRQSRPGTPPAGSTASFRASARNRCRPAGPAGARARPPCRSAPV